MMATISRYLIEKKNKNTQNTKIQESDIQESVSNLLFSPATGRATLQNIKAKQKSRIWILKGPCCNILAGSPSISMAHRLLPFN